MNPKMLVGLFISVALINSQIRSISPKDISIGLPLGRVTLLSDFNLYLARCHLCGQANYADSAAMFQGGAFNNQSIWTIEQVQDGKIAFKADTGYYLGRCQNCWRNSKNVDGIFAHVFDLKNSPWAKWKAEKQKNGKWSFRSDNGKYLARCNKCVQAAYQNFAFTHIQKVEGNPQTQWTINYVPNFPSGRITLQGDLGKFMTRCNKCGPGKYTDSVAVDSPNSNLPQAIWNIETYGDRIALKSDKGLYLSRCFKCWKNSATDEAVFSYVDILAGNPWALWTPKEVGNGKWALIADNGNYLSRCLNCVPSTSLNMVFAHVVGPEKDISWSQWIKYNPYCQWLIKQIGTLPQGSITLQGDLNGYISRCRNCGQAKYPDSVSVNETNPRNSQAVWKLETIGEKVAFKSDNGYYLSRCEKCWKSAAYPQYVFAHVDKLDGHPQSLWIPEFLGNQKWAFKGDNEKYLSRCNNCVSTAIFPNMAFVGSTSVNDPWSQWKVRKFQLFPQGMVNIQGDIGTYISRCRYCGAAKYQDSVAVHSTNPSDPMTTWTVQFVGDKVALKSDNGFYLSRCQNCWVTSRYVDGVFAHVAKIEGNSESLWTPQQLGNGKWALKGDNGKYLSRCLECANQVYKETLFVHVQSSPLENPWAQWKITTIN